MILMRVWGYPNRKFYITFYKLTESILIGYCNSYLIYIKLTILIDRLAVLMEQLTVSLDFFLQALSTKSVVGHGPLAPDHRKFSSEGVDSEHMHVTIHDAINTIHVTQVVSHIFQW